MAKTMSPFLLRVNLISLESSDDVLLPAKAPDLTVCGPSPKVSSGENVIAQTGWVRITQDDWHLGVGRQNHSYAAMLILEPKSEVAVRSLEIETREIQ